MGIIYCEPRGWRLIQKYVNKNNKHGRVNRASVSAVSLCSIKSEVDLTGVWPNVGHLEYQTHIYIGEYEYNRRIVLKITT